MQSPAGQFQASSWTLKSQSTVPWPERRTLGGILITPESLTAAGHTDLNLLALQLMTSLLPAGWRVSQAGRRGTGTEGTGAGDFYFLPGLFLALSPADRLDDHLQTTARLLPGLRQEPK